MTKWNSLNGERSAHVYGEGELDWFDLAALMRRMTRLLIINDPLSPETLCWLYRAASEGVDISIWRRSGDDLSKIMSPFGFNIIEADNWIDCWRKFQEK